MPAEAEGLARMAPSRPRRRRRRRRQAARRDAELEERVALQAGRSLIRLTASSRRLPRPPPSSPRVRGSEAEGSHLMKEKGELLAEIAKQAGHLNHKQKIQYVSKLKRTTTCRQLREAVDGKRR